MDADDDSDCIVESARECVRQSPTVCVAKASADIAAVGLELPRRTRAGDSSANTGGEKLPLSGRSCSDPVILTMAASARSWRLCRKSHEYCSFQREEKGRQGLLVLFSFPLFSSGTVLKRRRTDRCPLGASTTRRVPWPLQIFPTKLERRRLAAQSLQRDTTVSGSKRLRDFLSTHGSDVAF